MKYERRRDRQRRPYLWVRLAALLDALNAPEFDPCTRVDARWTPKQPVGVTPKNESDV
jgi:hypothetical protein